MREIQDMQMDKSIIEVLPEDILAIILSEYGLHASLGSTCRVMRTLSLSDKAIGSVCIRIKKDLTYSPDTKYILYSYAHRLNVDDIVDYESHRLLNYQRYHLSNDTLWPYLTELNILITESWVGVIVFNELKIHAPRLTKFQNKHILSDQIWSCHFDEIRRRMPMLPIPVVNCVFSEELPVYNLVKQGMHGFKVNEYFLTFSKLNDCYLAIERAYNEMEKQNNGKLQKFLNIIRLIGRGYSYSQNLELDAKFIQFVAKITKNTIITYLRLKDEDSDTQLIDKHIGVLYDFCFSTSNNTNSINIVSYIYTTKHIFQEMIINEEKRTLYVSRTLDMLKKYPKLHISREDIIHDEQPKPSFGCVLLF